MKAAIMGAGAMGTVLGAFLTRNGFPVDLIDSYPAQVDALNEKGAGVVGCAELTVPVRALLPEQMEGVYDLVFLMVKQTNNEASLRALLPHLGENSTVCTLQKRSAGISCGRVRRPEPHSRRSLPLGGHVCGARYLRADQRPLRPHGSV